MEWDEFLPHVLPSVKGCPDQIALDAIIRAARKFCRKTLVWNYPCDPVLTTNGLAAYVLQIGEGQELLKLLTVEVDEREHDVVEASFGRREARKSSCKRIAYIAGPQDVLLHPAPHADGLELVVDVAVMPALNAPEWPDDLAQYVEDIAHGAVSILKLEGSTDDWGDPDGAAVRETIFKDRMSTVGWQVSQGMGHRARRGRIQAF
jgi:hypothetical protein